jgi:nucleoid DNA-binding protein
MKIGTYRRTRRCNPHLRMGDTEVFINAILDGIANALGRGDRVELREFGILR